MSAVSGRTGSPPFRVLIAHDQILRRAHELARAIAQSVVSSYGDEPPMLIAVIEGARPFARLLQQLLPGQLPVHEVRASSYGAGTTSSGDVRISVGRELSVRGRHVLLVEDIVDTGRTVHTLQRHLTRAGARSCRVVALLSKPSRRVVDVAVDHVGFVIPDEFVLGFGLDLDGRYRELPDVVVYDAEVERAFGATAAP
jgi:hypoxanthine phosphoribosyltransferase